MGIIDILTPYDEMKTLEHRFKAHKKHRRAVGMEKRCSPLMKNHGRLYDTIGVGSRVALLPSTQVASAAS